MAKYSFIIILLISIFSSSNRADNILDLIEIKTQSESTIQHCQLTEEELKLLLESSNSEASQHLNNKYVLMRIQNNQYEDRFISESVFPLSSLGYKICTYYPCQTSSTKMLSNISILIESGHLIAYYGRHDPYTLTRFIAHLEQRLSNSSYHTIASKMDKKAYEHIMESKVIAYYPDKTAPGFSEFQKASKLMSPMPPFFVVHDSQIAAKFHLTQPGQISLVRRLEKSQIFFPSSPTPITFSDIVNWIQKNHGLILHEIKDINLYDPELQDPNKYQLVAVGDKSSPFGLYFFKILTKTIQNISRENEMKLNPMKFIDEDEVISSTNQNVNLNNTDQNIIRLDDIEIVWIDLVQFPNAALNLKNRYQMKPINNVWFGLIQTPPMASAITSKLDSIWFDLSMMNLTRGDRQNDQENILLVRNWILNVTNRHLNMTDGSIQMLKLNPFVLEPESVSIRPGGTFLLECKVKDGMKCGWIKDSRVIIMEEQFRYKFVQPEINGNDCSIMIREADTNQDSGEWICFVSDSEQHILKSKPVTVNVRTEPKTEF